MTLAQLEALEERRAIALRHSRFNAALIGSILINSHRAAESDSVSPFDFLAGFERDPEEVEKEKLRQSVKSAIALTLGHMAAKSPEELQKIVRDMIDRMRGNGIENPEELVREVFPELEA